ncbi:Alpha/Beta hydrolase protein [Cercophora newfieldiana]|uniref:Alpha/Beta hydrolase protein n=1 Tax=Cercophora newfieldiana TaxID=92897 RepID=A0AA40CRG1_9PEZI|nr:Alpha/Beta hydrolase protein [Cercophora newfieldiana]
MEYGDLPEGVREDVRPFGVSIADEELARMKALLSLSRIPSTCYENSLPNGSRALGLRQEWLVNYRKKHEQIINSFPKFKTTARNCTFHTTEIHFMALFSKKKAATPVLLLHGWPGSVLEFIPLLTLLRQKYPDPAHLPYHLIVPSLPGFGFSEAFPVGNDYGVPHVANIMADLMDDVLGFKDYVVQGGDIGSRIGRILAATDPNCAAALLNYSPIPQPPGMSRDDLTDDEKAGLDRGNWFRGDGCAYALTQATRPATVGLVLSTNPLALLAWVGEKYLDWVDPASFRPRSVLQGSGTAYSRELMEEILLSVSLYWLTNTAHTSLYSYRECFAISGPTRSAHHYEEWHIAAPKKLGFSYFPKEVAPTPRAWIATSGNLVYWKEHAKGGHFAALEQPVSILEDLEEFVTSCVGRD